MPTKPRVFDTSAYKIKILKLKLAEAQDALKVTADRCFWDDSEVTYARMVLTLERIKGIK